MTLSGLPDDGEIEAREDLQPGQVIPGLAFTVAPLTAVMLCLLSLFLPSSPFRPSQ